MNIIKILFFLLGSFGVSFFFKDKLFKFKNTLTLPLIYIFILNILIFNSYLICFFFYEKIFILKILFYFICLFSVYILVIIKDIKLDIKLSFEVIFLSIFIFLIFLSLFLPPTESDSLDYHLGVPKFWLDNKGFSPNYFWDTHYLVGSGEFLNFFGLYNGIENLNGIIQLIFLILVFISLNSCKHYSNQKNILFFIILFSNPIILPLVLGQKSFLIPSFIFFIIYFVISSLNQIKEEKLNIYIFIIIISALNFALSSKYSFLFPFVIFQFYLIYKFRNQFLNILVINLIIFMFISFPIFFKNYYFYDNPITPFYENIFSSNYLTNEKIKFSNYLKQYHSNYNNFYEYFLLISNIFIPKSLGAFFTVLTPIIFLIFFIKLYRNDISLFLIFGAILAFNLFIGQLTARYYLIVFIPIFYLIAQRFDFKKYIKFFAFTLCIPQLISIIYILFNFYNLPKENFLSKFVNEYNQIKWIEEIIDEKYITDLRMNYYSNNKVNISLFKWSEKYSKEISKVITKSNIQYVFISDNEKYETVFSDHFLLCGNHIKEINLPYATRNFFNEVSSYEMKLIKITEKCLN